MTPPHKLLHHRFGGVGEGTVADIMEERGRGDHPRLITIKPELVAHEPGEVHRPERVLEPGMVCAGVDEICKPELSHVAEPLDLYRVEQPEREIVRLDVAVDRVFDDLHQFR